MTVTEDAPAEGSVVASQPTIPHQPALDGLRGVAVAGVLLFHGGHLVGGYLGVDAFFVLSGFLITTLLLVEHGRRGRISLPRFWARRARRLLPALICVLFAVAIYAEFIAKRGELPTLRGDAFSTLFYVANWHAIFASSDYFAIFRSPSPLQHTWSLAIEEQFYFVWPVVLFVVLRKSTNPKTSAKRVLALSLVLAAASAVLFQILYRSSGPTRVYYGTDTRAAAVLIGAALAAASAAWGPIRGARLRRVLEGAAIVAIAFLAVMWTHLTGESYFLYHGGLLLCGIAVAVVIAAAVHPSRGLVSNALSLRALCWLGVISYGVYLWHWPIFVWLNNQRTGLSGWPLFGLQCTVTIVVSIASYRLIERPIRFGWGSPRVMAWATPLTAGALVAALLIASSGPPLAVFNAYAGGLSSVPAPTDPNWGGVVYRLSQQAATYPNANRVLVWGDSIALNLGDQYIAGFHGKNIEGAALGLIGCGLIQAPFIVGGTSVAEDPNCHYWPQLLKETVDDYRPKTVALMLGPWEMFDRETPNGREDAGSQALTQDLDAQLAVLRRVVVGAGAKLLILDTPCYGTPTNDPLYAGNVKVWRSQSRRDWLNGVWHSFAARHSADTSVAPLSNLLCVDGTKPIEDKIGGIDRGDGMHFTPTGAVVAWRWLDNYFGEEAKSSKSARS